MDESLRALQRQYEQGEISVIQWMRALQRAGLPHQELLIQTWERLLAIEDPPNYAAETARSIQYLYAALELLEAFPIKCTCRQCSWVSHNGFCTCCLTGVCAPHRDGLSGPGKVVMTTMGFCPSCRDSCPLNLPDVNWLHPGKLALEVTTFFEKKFVITYCKGHHYAPISECRGTVRQQILFMMRHAACRTDAGPPEERDEDLEAWRDILSELGPGEFPPY